MLDDLRTIRKQLRKETKLAAGPQFAQYVGRPDAYAKQVLKVQWWDKQRQIAESLEKPPYRTLVKASYGVGKSNVAAGLVNYRYDTRIPGICVTSAPTAKQIELVLWKEIRRQRRGRGGFIGPKAPMLQSAADHYAIGLTADRSEALQGQHEASVFVVLDEAVGVEPFIWEAADSLLMGQEFAFLAICNPTDQTSEFFRREQQSEIPYTTITITCLEHPNIAAELMGLPPVYPSAVRLKWVDEHIKLWCEPLGPGDKIENTDVLWPSLPGKPGGPAYEPVYNTPVGDSRWYRPGPEAEAKILGRWPSQAMGVWSDHLFGIMAAMDLPIPKGILPVIGCDVAAGGPDDTSFHVRCHYTSLHHEAINGQKIDSTIGRLKNLATQYARWATENQFATNAAPVDPQDIELRIDDTGVGRAVSQVLAGEGWRVVPIDAAKICKRPDLYPNTRSELWFDCAERARIGTMSMGRIDPKTVARIKVQAVAPIWKLDAAGRRVVEKKEETKKRIGGRSPDHMDGVNLAYYEVGSGPMGELIDSKKVDIFAPNESIPLQNPSKFAMLFGR